MLRAKGQKPRREATGRHEKKYCPAKSKNRTLHWGKTPGEEKRKHQSETPKEKMLKLEQIGQLRKRDHKKKKKRATQGLKRGGYHGSGRRVV